MSDKQRDRERERQREWVLHSLLKGSMFRLRLLSSEASSSFLLMHWTPRLAKLYKHKEL